MTTIISKTLGSQLTACLTMSSVNADPIKTPRTATMMLTALGYISVFCAEQGKACGRRHGAQHPGERGAEEREERASKRSGCQCGRDISGREIDTLCRFGTRIVRLQGRNCSRKIRSSRLWPSSNIISNSTDRSSEIWTSVTFRTSEWSATQLTGRLPASRISNRTSAV